jgi:poly(hydroxyalkanoate) depolymerase family esterase
MIVRTFKEIRRAIGAWLRPAVQTPEGRLYRGSHSAFGRTISLVQLTSGRRPYLLYLPRRYTPEVRLPMIVMMHGCKQDAHSFAEATRMNGLADRDEFIVLYPEQRRLANILRCWNWSSRSAQDGAGEAAILSDMIRSLASEYNVDTSRIYIAGLSAGAAMACNLAISHADLIAACALHSGLMFRAATSTGEALKAMRNGSRCDPQEAGRRAFSIARGKTDFMPALVIHGDSDDVVSPVNADQIVSQFEVLNQLLAEEANGRAERLIVRTSKSRSAGGYQFENNVYLRDEQRLIQKVMISGLGHSWSGGVADYPYNDPRGPSASELICDFFAEHGLRDASVQSPALRSAA